MELQATEVFEFLYDNYDQDIKQIFVLEGSSGSSKTYSTIQFLSWYAQINQAKKKRITCGRSKMTWTIDTIWQDFNDYLENNDYIYKKNRTKHKIDLNSNTFRFVGADDPQKFHGPRQDVAWFNEAMELDNNSFDQVNMRTNDLFILDYNPSATTHWIYDKLCANMKPHGIGRKKTTTFKDSDGNDMIVEVFYLRSTFLMNGFLPAGQRAIILSYDPDNPENVKNGTANPHKWKIYGKGERAQREGIIHKRWDTGYLNPNLRYIYGLDFGFRHPTALIKVAVDPVHRIIYAKEMIHKVGLTPTNLIKRFRNICNEQDIVIADPSGIDKINELRELDYNVIPANKPAGSVYKGLEDMQDFLIIFEDSPNLENEVNNYIWHEKIPDTPRKEFDDGMDAIRYAFEFYMNNL